MWYLINIKSYDVVGYDEDEDLCFAFGEANLPDFDIVAQGHLPKSYNDDQIFDLYNSLGLPYLESLLPRQQMLKRFWDRLPGDLPPLTEVYDIMPKPAAKTAGKAASKAPAKKTKAKKSATGGKKRTVLADGATFTAAAEEVPFREGTLRYTLISPLIGKELTAGQYVTAAKRKKPAKRNGTPMEESDIKGHLVWMVKEGHVAMTTPEGGDLTD